MGGEPLSVSGLKLSRARALRGQATPRVVGVNRSRLDTDANLGHWKVDTLKHCLRQLSFCPKL